MANEWKLKREKILSRAQVRSILDTARRNDERDYLILAIAANAGFRISEILHLKVSDVGSDSLRITRRKKAKLEDEDVPVSAGLVKLILESNLVRSTGARFSPREKKGDRWLFPGESEPCHRQKEQLCEGGHVSKREVQRRWEAYLRSLKLLVRGRGIHSLRHYAGTEFYGVHKDLRATQLFMGHSSSAVTETYAHVREMAEKIRKVKPTL